MPPGKKWPTLRVRTTTSTRADSPRRSAASTLPSGASIGATSRSTVCDAPRLPPSSPTANVLAIRGSPAFAVRVSAGGPGCSPGTSPKTSTLTTPSFRNSCVMRSCSWSPLTNGSAVLAAAKRCDFTLPPSCATGSFEATSGMWQSLHFCGLGG